MWPCEDVKAFLLVVCGLLAVHHGVPRVDVHLRLSLTVHLTLIEKTRTAESVSLTMLHSVGAVPLPPDIADTGTKAVPLYFIAVKVYRYI